MMCKHSWRQYSDSDRYYCIYCLAQRIVSFNWDDKKISIHSEVKGLE